MGWQVSRSLVCDPYPYLCLPILMTHAGHKTHADAWKQLAACIPLSGSVPGREKEVDEQGCKWTYLSKDTIKYGHVSGVIGEDRTRNRIDKRETWFGK